MTGNATATHFSSTHDTKRHRTLTFRWHQEKIKVKHPSETNAKLETTLSTVQQNKDQTQNSHKQ